MIKALNLGSRLSKKELRNLKGGTEELEGVDGADSTGGSCCVTVVGNVSTARSCGYTRAQAIAEANTVAGWGGGVRAYWCCASC